MLWWFQKRQDNDDDDDDIKERKEMKQKLIKENMYGWLNYLLKFTLIYMKNLIKKLI